MLPRPRSSTPTGWRGQGSTVAATTRGEVVAYEGDGTRAWRHDFGDYAAVHAFGDDGSDEAVVMHGDGRVAALDYSE